jgi:hypothetical protein
LEFFQRSSIKNQFNPDFAVGKESNDGFFLSIRELGWLQRFLFPKYSFHLLLMKLLNSVFANVFVNSAVCPPGISTN